MSTLGNSVGPKQWDTYDKAEVNDAIAVVDAKADGANTALNNVYTKTETDTQISTAVGDIDLSSKQDTLVSGTNIKTIAGQNIVGSGDIPASIFGGQADFQEFTTSGTWTKPDGCNYVYVEIVNGGQGGLASSNSPASQVSASGGAGGLALCHVLDANSLHSTVSVIIGAGGAGMVRDQYTIFTPPGLGGISSFNGFTPYWSNGNLNLNISGRTYDSVCGVSGVTKNYNSGIVYRLNEINPRYSLSCVIGGGAGGSVQEAIIKPFGASDIHGDGAPAVLATKNNNTAIAGGGGGACGVVNYGNTAWTATAGNGGNGIVKVWAW